MEILTKAKNFILDTLFPIACVNCGADDIWLCDQCLSEFKLLSFQVCPQCEKTITEYGQLCIHCKITSNPLDGLIVATNYQENNIAKLVHLFKYNFIEDLQFPLGKILTKTILKHNFPLPDIIIPIPLHNRRRRFRGFNQSELLAKYLSQNITPGFEIPLFSNLLTRKVYTTPQMKIGKYLDRQKNIQNAFAINNAGHWVSLWTPSVQIEGKNILLVDDIATTGATLSECAKVLKQNGAKKVFAAVIARQSFK